MSAAYHFQEQSPIQPWSALFSRLLLDSSLSSVFIFKAEEREEAEIRIYGYALKQQ